MALEELACSKSGTHLLYLNGMFNSEGKEVKGSVQHLQEVVLNSLDDRKKVDKKGDITISHSYQVSLFFTNKSIPGKTVGFMADIMEVLGNYVQDQIEFSEIEDTSVWDALPGHFFKATKYLAPKKSRAVKSVNNLRRVTEGFYTPTFGEDFQISDTGRAVDAIIDLLKDGKKIILVSHSQGNFFANQVYNNLFNGDHGIELDRYKNLYGNMQIATPVSFISTPNNEYITSVQDIVIDLIIPNNLPGNVTYVGKSHLQEDKIGHAFTLYTSDNILVENHEDNNVYTGKDLFLKKMNLIASRFAPNCCLDENGEVASTELRTFMNKAYDRDENDNYTELPEKEEGGLVAADVLDSGRIDPNAYIGKKVVVCSGAEILDSSVLQGPMEISGNVSISNAEIISNENTGENLIINGNGSLTLRIKGSKGPEVGRDVKSRNGVILPLKINANNLEISGNSKIDGGGELIISGNVRKTISGSTITLGLTDFLREKLGGENPPFHTMYSTDLNMTDSQLVNSLAGGKTSLTLTNVNNSEIQSSTLTNSNISEESSVVNLKEVTNNLTAISSYIANSTLGEGVQALSSGITENSVVGAGSILNDNSSVIEAHILENSNLVRSSVSRISEENAGELHLIDSSVSASRLPASFTANDTVVSDSDIFDGPPEINHSEISGNSTISGTSTVISYASIQNSNINGATAITGNSNTGEMVQISFSDVFSFAQITGKSIITGSDIYQGANISDSSVSGSEIWGTVSNSNVSSSSEIKSGAIVSDGSDVSESYVSGSVSSSDVRKSRITGSVALESIITDSQVSGTVINSSVTGLAIGSISNSICAAGNDPVCTPK